MLGAPAKANGVTAGSSGTINPPLRDEGAATATAGAAEILALCIWSAPALEFARLSCFAFSSLATVLTKRFFAAASMRTLRLASILSLRPAAVIEVDICAPTELVLMELPDDDKAAL